MGTRQDQIEAAIAYFARPDAARRSGPERRAHMDVIQALADELSPQRYAEYVRAWAGDPAAAEAMEQHGVLNVLRRAIDRAIDEIHTRRVSRGVILWHLYNHGYVVRTPDCCFGIDLHFRNAGRLAEDLDFLLVTHGHVDHLSADLHEAMRRAGKPVIDRAYLDPPAGRAVDPPPAPAPPSRRLTLGPVEVKVDWGDHHPPPSPSNDMLMFQVDCGAAAGHFTLYHCGDNSNLQKIVPDRPLDVLILHIEVGLPVRDTIRQLQPRLAFLSHVLELSHAITPPRAWRWSYAHAYNRAKDTPPDRFVVPVWGECWTFGS